MTQVRSAEIPEKGRSSARVGYALIGLALPIAALGGVFPHGSQWVIAAVLLSAGVTLVRRARGRKPKPARPATAGPTQSRFRPSKPGETYQDAVKSGKESPT